MRDLPSRINIIFCLIQAMVRSDYDDSETRFERVGTMV